MQYQLLAKSPAARGTKTSLPLSCAPVAELPAERCFFRVADPSGRAPSPSDWDSQAARWRGARAESSDGPRPLQAQAAGRLLLGDLLHPDQHRRGEGLLGTWLETDLVCRTPRLSVGLSLGDTVPTPRAPARPAPFTRAGRRPRVRGGGRAHLAPPPPLKPQDPPGVTTPPRAAPHGARAHQSAWRGLGPRCKRQSTPLLKRELPGGR